MMRWGVEWREREVGGVWSVWMRLGLRFRTRRAALALASVLRESGVIDARPAKGA